MKKGFTLLETTIAMALLSMCVIGFIEALNVAILGTNEVERSNAAAELVRSQMEYIQQKDYDCNASSIPNLYGNVSELPAGFTTDDIRTTVSNVSGMDYRAIQQITVNVSYTSGGVRYIRLTDYKTPRLANIAISQECFLVTKKVNIPTLPNTGLFSGAPCWGYYYTFHTGSTGFCGAGPISIMWKLRTPSWGALNGVTLYLYNESRRGSFPTDDAGLIQMTPPSGYVAFVGSWLDVDREICAIETTAMPQGEYTAYYYNDGIAHICSLLSIFTVPPSTSTITYTK